MPRILKQLIDRILRMLPTQKGDRVMVDQWEYAELCHGLDLIAQTTLQAQQSKYTMVAGYAVRREP
ncbi:MAG: hypothetical protein WDN46_17230 [Methylocella sp.]